MHFTSPADLGNQIRYKRKAQGFQQEDCAAYAGVSARTIRNIEKGLSGTKTETVFTLTHELGLRLFFGLKDTPQAWSLDSFAELSHQICQTRKNQKIRQDDLAAIVGVQPSVIGRLEKGDGSVSIGTLFNVLNELGLVLSDGAK
jgi:transcriptional regulator with XRE-family HTH domain